MVMFSVVPETEAVVDYKPCGLCDGDVRRCPFSSTLSCPMSTASCTISYVTKPKGDFSVTIKLPRPKMSDGAPDEVTADVMGAVFRAMPVAMRAEDV